ncbi:thioesterase [Hoylesella loescheii]|nr:thioesterase [Hoylesella loescheii]
MNRRVKCILEGRSISSGMLFQLNWNTVPTYLEQGSILAITRRELKKLTSRAYRVGNERWRLEVG